jgi:phenylalanyl-tRNA synthetase beta chain
MKVPLSWLKEYLDLPLSSKEIADTLTLAGLEVEGISDEEIFDIALTPNLGHCMSMLGIARELSALLNIPLKKQPANTVESSSSLESEIRVHLIDRTQALRFGCCIVKGVKIGSSPEWIQKNSRHLVSAASTMSSISEIS